MTKIKRFSYEMITFTDNPFDFRCREKSDVSGKTQYKVIINLIVWKKKLCFHKNVYLR